ncbi:FIG056164: rhomboid family serine protease [hydrothermal vent metagenome]|uniref:FIG056164: rhomboid family serine protease n=1 Tax=hydrothermal vent metagenome TaxID=652676 RepID=A0A3B0T4H5_9ZZZZ
MFVPLKDRNQLRVIPFPYVNVGIIVVTVAIFFLFQSGLVFSLQNGDLAFAVIPAVVFDFKTLPEGFIELPADLTLVTYVFLHGGWLHLAGNMAFLWVFGDNIEDAMGHVNYLIFYLLCGVAAGLAHAVMQPSSEAPLVGASGAVAGVIAAYLMLHPRVKVWVLVLWRVPLLLPAYLVLGLWVGFQVFNVVLAGPEDGVAWWAHIGGLAAGALLIVVFKRRDVPLFDRDLPR